MKTQRETELIQEIETLRQSEQRARALFQGMPVPAYSWQRSGQGFVLVDYNLAADEITGGKVRDFVGMTAAAMYPDRPDIIEDMSHALAERASFQREMEYSFKSTGEDKTLVVKYAFVPPDVVLVQTEDITKLVRLNEQLRQEIAERKKAQRESQTQISLLDGLLDATPETIEIFDANTMEYIRWNRAFRELSGYTDDEIAALDPIADFFDDADLARTEAAWATVLQEGQVTVTANQIRKDGSRVPMEFTAALIRDPDGKPMYAISFGRDIAERLWAEQQLRFQAELLEAVEQAVIVVDLDGSVVYWNPFAEELYGWSAEEALGRQTNELMIGDYGQDVIREINARLQAGRSWSGEYAAFHRDGRIMPVHATISPIFDEGGERRYHIGVAHDITKRKRAEEALQASQRFTQSSLDALSAHIAILDDKGTILWVNESWRQFADQNDLAWDDYGVGHNYLEVAETASGDHRQGAHEAAAALRETLAGERETFQLEYPCHSAETERWFMQRATCFDSRRGMRVVMSHENITERKQAELELLESEEQYRDLVEKVSDVIYSIDVEGVITYVNPAIESLLELTPEQVVGQPFARFIHSEDLEQSQVNAQTLLSGEVPGPAEYRMLSPSGETRWARVTSQPIIDGGQITGFRGVLTDITGRKQGEIELEEAATAAERQRLARDLHDSVTQTLYSLDLFANAAQEALSKGRIETGTEHAGRIRALSQSVLADMRLLIFELQPPLLEQKGLAGALRARLQSVEARAGIKTEIEANVERPLPALVQSELYAVAREALNNALKHAETDRISVKLDCDEQGCCLTIQDDGIGFDLAAVERSGGFGLRNMRSRVERINGNLTLDTAPGKGTTVRVEVTA